MLPQKSIQRLSFWKEPIMPRWPACGSTTPRRALLPYPKDDIGAATGMPDFLATALLNLVYVAHGNAWPTSRPKSAATMLRSMAASSAKGYLACPSAGLATVYSRRRQLSEARPGDEPSRTTASAAQFRATGIVSLVARSCKFQDLWLYLTAASTLWFPYRSIQTRSKYGRDYLGSDLRLQDHRVREVAHMDGAGRASEEGRARGLVAISCHDGFSQCLVCIGRKCSHKHGYNPQPYGVQ
jgi:hypothetical protein